ncbi:MAG: glycosyltransferase [Caldicoprobacterales bacterium]|jgi:hypothetical protein|nr:hypothetical protein [Clostridiales bacterium]
MYVPTYLAVILWVFALFGIVCLITRLIMGYKWRGSAHKGKYSIVISAKNQEDTIEGFVRGFILKAGIEGQEEALLNVVLVDADSSDDTPRVMRRLAEEYCYVKFVTCQELPAYLKSIWHKEEGE